MERLAASWEMTDSSMNPQFLSGILPGISLAGNAVADSFLIGSGFRRWTHPSSALANEIDRRLPAHSSPVRPAKTGILPVLSRAGIVPSSGGRGPASLPGWIRFPLPLCNGRRAVVVVRANCFRGGLKTLAGCCALAPGRRYEKATEWQRLDGPGEESIESGVVLVKGSLQAQKGRAQAILEPIGRF